MSPLSELQTVVDHKFVEFLKHGSFRDCSFDKKSGQIKSWPSKNVLNDKLGKGVLRTIDTSQVIAHTMIPTLLSLEPKSNLIKFYEGCKTLKTSGLETPIWSWLPKGIVRIQLYWIARSEELVSSEEELDEILEDTDRFFKLCEGLIRAWKLPKGDLTDANLVRQQIKVMLGNLSQEDIRGVCKVLGNFQADHPEIYQNVDDADQSALVMACIETNLRAPNASTAQKVIFQFLKDCQEPKITAMKQMFELLMLKINAIRKSCNEAYAVGMRFPDEENAKTLNHEKIGGGNKAFKKRTNEDGSEMGPDSKKNKEETVECTLCGVKGHMIGTCKKKNDQSQWLNNEDCCYRKSNVWAELSAKFPKWHKVLDYPRYPHASLLKRLEEEAKKPNKPKGKIPTEDINMNFKQRDQCHLCSAHNTHEFKIIDDEIVNILTHKKISPYLNIVEIYTPRKKGVAFQDPIASKALIDTGALHGSYVGTWIKTHDLSVIEQHNNKLICSPINNSCVSLTDTVHAIVSIFDIDKINKFKIEIELKILSALDDKEYGLIIKLPDIIKNDLLNKLYSQFTDRKIRTNMRELQSVSIGEDFDAYSESDKFANLPSKRGIASVEGELQSSMSV